MKYPKLYSYDETSVIDILNNAYDIFIESEKITRTGGSEILTFKMPYNDSKIQYIENEMVVEVDNRKFIIKNCKSSKQSELEFLVTCDALWYELGDGELKSHVVSTKQTATQALTTELEGTGWTTGTIEPTDIHSFSLTTASSVLYNLRCLAKIYSAELKFDTKNRIVHLLTDQGERKNEIFKYSKNLSGIIREIDTTELVTRFTLTGGGGITIGPINNNVDYLENYSYFDNRGMPRKLKALEKSDERFTDRESMYEYMENYLAMSAFPVVTYEISVMALRTNPELCDYIYVIDTDAGIKSWLQILGVKKDILSPENTVFTLESLSKTLNDLLSSEEDIESFVTSSIEARDLVTSEYVETLVEDTGENILAQVSASYITANDKVPLRNLLLDSMRCSYHVDNSDFSSFEITIGEYTLSEGITPAIGSIVSLFFKAYGPVGAFISVRQGSVEIFSSTAIQTTTSTHYFKTNIPLANLSRDITIVCYQQSATSQAYPCGVDFACLFKGIVQRPNDDGWIAAPEDTGADIESARNDIIETVESHIDVKVGEIEKYVADTYATITDTDAVATRVSSLETQTSEQIEFVFERAKGYCDDVTGEMTDISESIRSWFTFSENGLEIGKSNTDFALNISNESISFFCGDEQLGYFQNTKMYVPDSIEVGNVITIGNDDFGKWSWEVGDNGHFRLRSGD